MYKGTWNSATQCFGAACVTKQAGEVRHKLPRNSVCHNFIFSFINLFYTDQLKTCFSVFLHDVQDVTNYQFINQLVNVLYKTIRCAYSVGSKRVGDVNVLKR